MFSFLRTLRSSRRRNGLAVPAARGRRPSFRPALEALEDRLALTTFATTGLISSVNNTTGLISTLGLYSQQPLSNLSSVTAFNGTFYFEIGPQNVISYTNNGGQTWQSTGLQGISISAGVDGVGDADVYLITLDHSVWMYDTHSNQASDLGGYAKAISAVQGPVSSVHPDISLVFAIGSNNQLYVNGEGGNGSTWKALLAPNASWITSSGTNSPGTPLVTISAVGATGLPGGDNTVFCYATDSSGDIYDYVNGEALSGWNWATGIWFDTGGRNAVQIAASYDASHNPIVFALTTDTKVWEGWRGGFGGWNWTALGSGFVEISANRSATASTAADTVYAIASSSHNLHVLSVGSGQNLGGSWTAVTAEGGTAFATDTSFDPWVYASVWRDMHGPQILKESMPIFG
jgi:hypothetical protein